MTRDNHAAPRLFGWFGTDSVVRVEALSAMADGREYRYAQAGPLALATIGGTVAACSER